MPLPRVRMADHQRVPQGLLAKDQRRLLLHLFLWELMGSRILREAFAAMKRWHRQTGAVQVHRRLGGRIGIVWRAQAREDKGRDYRSSLAFVCRKSVWKRLGMLRGDEDIPSLAKKVVPSKDSSAQPSGGGAQLKSSGRLHSAGSMAARGDSELEPEP